MGGVQRPLMAGLFFKNHGQNCGSKIPLIHRLNIKNTTFELNPLFENCKYEKLMI